MRRSGRRPPAASGGQAGFARFGGFAAGPAARPPVSAETLPKKNIRRRRQENADQKADTLLPGDAAIHRGGALPGTVSQFVQRGRRGAVEHPPDGRGRHGVLRPVPPQPAGILRAKKRLPAGNGALHRHEKHRPAVPAAHRPVGGGRPAGSRASGDGPVCVAGGNTRHRAAGPRSDHGGAGRIRGAPRRFGGEDRRPNGGAPDADPVCGDRMDHRECGG